MDEDVAIIANSISAAPSLSQQHVTGKSVFWALATLSLSAMAQPSFNGYVWSGDAFEDSLWPHRSSPSISILDAIIEAAAMFRAFRHTSETPSNESEQSESHIERAKPTIIAMRLAIFVLGALPQAIKLFSMRGIPFSQALAATFLVANIVGLVRALRTAHPEDDMAAMVRRERQQAASLRGSDVDPITTPRFQLALLGWVPHLAGLLWIWYVIAGHISITMPQDVVDLMAWLEALGFLLTFLFTLCRATLRMLGSKSPLPRVLSAFFAYMPWSLSSMINLWRGEKEISNRSAYTLWMLFSLSVVCFILTFALHTCARALLQQPASSTSHSALPHDSQTGAADSSNVADERSGEHTSAGEGATDRGQVDASSDDNFPWYLRVFVVYPLLVLFVVHLCTKRLRSLMSTGEEPASNSEAASEGASPPSPPPKRFSLWKRALLFPIVAVVEFLSAFFALYNDSVNCIEFWVSRQSKDILWLTFGMLNFATLMLYYLIVFDGAGTTNPRWTSVLG